MKTWRLFLILALVCGSSVLAVTLSAVESSPPTAHGRQGAAGDVAPYCDPDGELTLADAAVAIQILLGILEPCPGDLARADLAPVVTEGDEAVVDEYGCFTPDGDGALTAEDMALIFGAAVGLTCLHKPDSDGDGLSDEHEDGLGTDPDDPDSDDDGLLDGEEVHEHGTQPLVMDTDSDGYDDYAEVSWGSSPLDEASHPVLPDPEEVAPDVDSTVATDMHEATEFLYTGPSPIQIGVAAGTIEPIRTAVLRGSVTVRSRSPLNGVKITVLDHSEFGQTLTREDGRYDMAVNGGGSLTVVYEKEGYLPAQRQVDVPWRDYVLLSDVVMIPFDTQVTSIDLTEPSEYQVARGSEVTDGDGTRQATLFFPPGTRASLKLPDGRREYRSSLNVRATEYTVGESGPDAMPAELPPTSAYTYAIEFSADEAVAAGARDVRFDRPVISYTENFLDMPVGDAVPVGYYDREQGEWIAQENGRIVVDRAIVSAVLDHPEKDHASNYGVPVAAALAEKLQVPAVVVDPVVVDEFTPEAEISGYQPIVRRSTAHPLSVRAASRRAAEVIGLPLEDLNLVVAHLGGGITVAAVRGGKIVDNNIALLGGGPFTPQRAGDLPLGELIDLCYSGRFTHQEMIAELTTRGGLRSYLGTDRMEEIEQRIAGGDRQARLVVDAMIYQVAKEIGKAFVAAGCDVEAIVLTGGLARSELVRTALRRRVGRLAPVIVFEGSLEMAALAAGAIDVLSGRAQPRRYTLPEGLNKSGDDRDE